MGKVFVISEEKGNNLDELEREKSIGLKVGERKENRNNCYMLKKIEIKN